MNWIRKNKALLFYGMMGITNVPLAVLIIWYGSWTTRVMFVIIAVPIFWLAFYKGDGA